MPGTTASVHDSDGRPIQTIVKSLTPTLDTNAYADGDVLFVSTELSGLTKKTGGRLELHSVIASDGDDQNIGFDLVFSNAQITLGTINAAVSISDADAATIVGYCSLTTTESKDLINSRLFVLGNIGITMQLADTASSLWVAGIVRGGTPTYSASGMKLKFGFLGV